MSTITLGHLLTILAMLGGLGGVWATLSNELGRQNEKVAQLEQRLAEDRIFSREQVNDVRAQVKIIDQNVVLILQKMIALEVEAKANKRTHP